MAAANGRGALLRAARGAEQVHQGWGRWAILFHASGMKRPPSVANAFKPG